jgi:hypothetical protein
VSWSEPICGTAHPRWRERGITVTKRPPALAICRMLSNEQSLLSATYRKSVHRHVSAQQAHVLRQAIDSYKQVKKLLREWEDNTERLIDAVQPDQP